MAEVLAERCEPQQTDAAVVDAGFRYANLAIRGLGLGHVIADQVPVALTMRPDLISLAAGGNDVLRPGFDVAALGRQLDATVAALVATGATVLVFAGFAPGPGLPFRSTIAARADAYNRTVRAAAQRHGAILIDLWAMDELADRRMWSVDRLHLSPSGHRHVCGAVLVALGVEPPFAWPGTDSTDSPARQATARASRLAARRADLAWGREYFLPWLGRRVRGRSSADDMAAKRPELVPLDRSTDLFEEAPSS